MESITKNKQSQETIAKIAEKAFGSEVKLEAYKELSEEFYNVAYDLKLSDGRSAILKIGPAPGIQMMSCETELMQTEVLAMKYAKGHGFAGVPEVYFYNSSRELCSGEYFLMEKFDGSNFVFSKEQMSEAEIKELNRQTGEELYKLHQIQGEKFGHLCVKELQFSDWYTAFRTFLERIISDGAAADIDIGVSYEEILALPGAQRRYFEEVKTPRLIHWDSWEGNIFIKDGKIQGFIDWERALFAEGLTEDLFRLHSVNENFLAGYGLKELSLGQKIRSYWYDIYLYLSMMFEVTYRHYESNEQYVWVHGLFERVWKELKIIHSNNV